MFTRSVVLVFAFLVLWGVGGCGMQTATFPERDPARVWSAMITAAEEPVYSDWRVIDNEVWTNRDRAEIEIFRVLRRDLIEPGHSSQRESRTWKFQIRMIKGDPPTVQFSARQLAVPAHVWKQGQQFFDDVAALLESTVVEVEDIQERIDEEAGTSVEEDVTIEAEVKPEETPVIGADILESSSDTSSEDG